MAENQSNRKQEILDVARQEYIQNGSTGVSLQTVADEVGVTKAMIHYYYDTKENLYRKVFKRVCKEVFGDVGRVLESDRSLFEKIDRFVRDLVERVHRSPKAATFVISELNQQPKSTLDLFAASIGFDAALLNRQLDQAASNYEIARVDSNQILANIFSLCLFPYSGDVFIREFLDIQNEQEYDSFLKKRSGIISDTVINWLAS